MADTSIDAIADDLFHREEQALAGPPISTTIHGADVSVAYAIQEAYAHLWANRGARLVGRKIGCTNTVVQRQFGIDVPDFGQLFDHMQVPDGGTVDLSSLIQPMIEAEIAFILDHDLHGPGVTRADALAATGAVMPSLEIIDSRIESWRISFIDTVADNGSSARFTCGKPIGFTDQDLAATRVTMSRDGELLDEGHGSAVLGHPAEAVAWLANALGTLGQPLQAGQIILSGSMTKAVPVTEPGVYEATFSELGSVSCRFA